MKHVSDYRDVSEPTASSSRNLLTGGFAASSYSEKN